ncbi:dnaJ homolog subfamily C member 12 isoform X2 [Peromyscus leucopus]|uniref:dnaJ homolog subfamily C member 12 isoform X2 n=1 Tax=Peromyscus leucopus TaxID=10041 RepID=UPI001884C01E|nr:dnaJ homolog subfamily C member 12 isoform X2 [Peromyscus leucopus]
MDAILNYRPEGGEDYYALLGCDELSSVEQILAEFKVRALECHPDKHPENSKAVETFQRLQKAKEILTNAESRARYDHWRRSQMSMPFEQWEALADSVKTVKSSGGENKDLSEKTSPLQEDADVSIRVRAECLRKHPPV